MSNEMPDSEAATAEPHPGVAVIRRILQGAHPDDAEAIRGWLTALPADLDATARERDQWREQAMTLLFDHEGLLGKLREKAEHVDSIIAAHERKTVALNETLRSFAKSLDSVVKQHVSAILGEAGESRNA